jgi:hypothetical protein
MKLSQAAGLGLSSYLAGQREQYMYIYTYLHLHTHTHIHTCVQMAYGADKAR